jgi:hypothetical protein
LSLAVVAVAKLERNCREMTSREELISTNLSLASWEQERDESTIERLDAAISRDLLFRRANGTVVGKPEFMADLHKPSPFVERSSKIGAVEIREDRALVVSTVVGKTADGALKRYRNLRFFVSTNDVWQLVFWFNDELP